MPSSNKTSHGLNKWELGDIPSFDDHNNDNEVVNDSVMWKSDFAVSGVEGVVDKALIADEATTAQNIDGGTYSNPTGRIKHMVQDGTEPVPSTLPFGEFAVAKDGTVFMGNENNMPVEYVRKDKISEWTPIEITLASGVTQISTSTAMLRFNEVTKQIILNLAVEKTGGFSAGAHHDIGRYDPKYVPNGLEDTNVPGSGFSANVNIVYLMSTGQIKVYPVANTERIFASYTWFLNE